MSCYNLDSSSSSSSTIRKDDEENERMRARRAIMTHKWVMSIPENALPDEDVECFDDKLLIYNLLREKEKSQDLLQKFEDLLLNNVPSEEELAEKYIKKVDKPAMDENKYVAAGWINRSTFSGQQHKWDEYPWKEILLEKELIKSGEKGAAGKLLECILPKAKTITETMLETEDRNSTKEQKDTVLKKHSFNIARRIMSSFSKKDTKTCAHKCHITNQRNARKRADTRQGFHNKPTTKPVYKSVYKLSEFIIKKQQNGRLNGKLKSTTLEQFKKSAKFKELPTYDSLYSAVETDTDSEYFDSDVESTEEFLCKKCSEIVLSEQLQKKHVQTETKWDSPEMINKSVQTDNFANSQNNETKYNEK